MVARHFAHIRTWVFDLENTFYSPEARLFDQIEVRMTAWVMQALGVDRLEADRLRALYWRHYGITQAGLMDVHSMEHAGFRPKPERGAFETVFATGGTTPETAAMFVGDIRNLAAPHAMGMRTVHVTPDPDPQPHIYHHTDDLAGFPGRVLDLSRPTAKAI